MSAPGVLDITDLRIGLQANRSVELLHGVSIRLEPGERVGLVGESGSGKSLLSLSVMGLQPPAIDIRSGSIRVAGTEVIGSTEKQLDRLRGSTMAMIYQDPMSSLNPVRSVGKQIIEEIRAHRTVSRTLARRTAIDLLGSVGVRDPQHTVDNYPHEFSGGMRQRVMIAMAISCEPALLMADEPTTALDVTTQAKIMELLSNLVDQRGMSVIFVTHDIALASSFCSRIDVMRRGEIVESGATVTMMTGPRHPYTRALLGSICTFDTDPNQPLLAGPADTATPGGAR
ncbi:ABC transporter ATP-binding protein, partial [Nakamurella lactea]|uniref:ABC transporter ATP-binding protein n=1 Tax=Nakamurella lactea TaxID=459515 RepID=UPI0003FCD47A